MCKVFRYVTCFKFVVREGEGSRTLSASCGPRRLSIEWGYDNPAGTTRALKNIHLHKAEFSTAVSHTHLVKRPEHTSEKSRRFACAASSVATLGCYRRLQS